MNPFPPPSLYPPEQEGYRLLPRKLFALKGNPVYIRFGNVAYHPIPNAIICDPDEGPGRHDEALWSWLPEEAGQATLRISFYSGYNLDAWKSEEVSCITTDPKSVSSIRPIRWLSIGDSLSAPGAYQAHTLALFSSLIPKVSLKTIGTKQEINNGQEIRHEGRPGWSWKAYLTGTPPVYREHSPFLFDDELDPARYMKEFHQEHPPDFITFFLGANDVFGIASDYSYPKVRQIAESAERLVCKMRNAAPNARIGILLPPPPSRQDGFGENYGTGISEWQYRRALQVYYREMLHVFDGMDDPIDMVPIHLSFNPENSYPIKDGKPCNALHPAPVGYESMAPALAAWIAHYLAQPDSKNP